MTNAKELLDKRILINLSDNDAPQSAVLKSISPNKLYVLLNAEYRNDTLSGWFKADEITLLDVLSNE
jgi:hypothetical protein